MNTYASASGAAMFIPRNIDKTVPKMARLLSNDNEGEDELQTSA